jgi:uncharacterized protein DUF6624
MTARPDLRDRLIALRDHDLAVRSRLAADGALFQGYHPEMQAVHEANAMLLMHVVGEHGWPGRSLVGEDGADAAWTIAQHAIGLPKIQRACLAALDAAVAAGEAPRRHLAYLEDRVRTLEGKPQRYGTQFDWVPSGGMAPLPIEDPNGVEARRAAASLLTLVEALALNRREVDDRHAPKDLAKRLREMDAWAVKVGWR